MKKLYTRVSIYSCLCLSVFISACKKDFLEKKPQGTLSETTLANKAGVNGLLIGAYSLLDGVGGPTASVGVWSQSISNWQYGGVASDDAHKGSEYGDQTDLELIENYTHTPVNPYFDGKWVALYTGIQRANDVLRVLTKVEAGALTDDEALQIKAEAVFLRAVYHFEAAKMWLNIPYVSDSVSFENNNYQIPNTESVWAKIEADLQFAATNLSELKSDVGRA
ncbi:MAG TPA: RagB/SusD family nutrient uptake outer membrane protein, partial [Flavitalea sp.]|nr:RagB/SusD family nutrient uptake outer membrane protein [Flavitalea sp.]